MGTLSLRCPSLEADYPRKHFLDPCLWSSVTEHRMHTGHTASLANLRRRVPKHPARRPRGSISTQRSIALSGIEAQVGLPHAFDLLSRHCHHGTNCHDLVLVCAKSHLTLYILIRRPFHRILLCLLTIHSGNVPCNFLLDSDTSSSWLIIWHFSCLETSRPTHMASWPNSSAGRLAASSPMPFWSRSHMG